MNISAYFSEYGTPKTGLSATITIYDVSDSSVVINAAAMTEMANGFYTYVFAAIDTSKEYTAICDSVTLTGPERYAVLGFSSLATETKQDIIDTNVDTINSNVVSIETKVDTIDTVVDAIKLKTDTLGGAGAITYTYTVTDSVTGNPIDGVAVWVTTDSAGANTIASGTTDDSGVVTFYLDAGTKYFWRSRSGYNFTNPDTEVVS